MAAQRAAAGAGPRGAGGWGPGRTAALLLLALAAILSGCRGGVGGVGGASRADILVLAIPSEVKSLDPAVGYDTYSGSVIHAIALGLLDYDEATTLTPALAASWEASPDHCTFAFRLREDLRFSNGRQVTAADFKYSLQRVLDPKTQSPGASFYLGLEGAEAFRAGKQPGVVGIRVTDPQHLVFRLKEPSPVFPYHLAMTFAAPVAREAVEKEGDRFGDRPVTCGPFRVERWQRGAALELVRNEPPGQGRPARVRIDISVPEALQMTRFDTGALDVTSGVPASQLPRVRGDSRTRALLEETPLNQTWYFGMNTRRPPFDDPRVRQAVNHAVDREKQVQVAGSGLPAPSILPPQMPGHDPELAPYARDLDRARALLRAAGHPEGVRAVMLIGNDELYRRRAQALQADLREVGVELEIQEMELIRYLSAYKSESAQCWYGGWYQDYPDPSNFLEVLFHSRNIRPSGGLNATRYRNPEVDRLLDRAARMPLGEPRLELYRDVEKRVMRDAPWAPLYYQVDVRLRQANVGGAKPHPVWPYLLLQNLTK